MPKGIMFWEPKKLVTFLTKLKRLQNLIEDITFDGIDYSAEKLTDTEYENCSFKNCSFAEHSISNSTFRECEFNECNFGKALLNHTVFNDVTFLDCKMLGLDFSVCNTMLLSFTLTGCNLSFASFYQLKLKTTTFTDCNLEGVDFTETDLTSSFFNHCDLKQTIFQYTILEKVNFSTAKNFSIDPEINKIKKARFSKSGLLGLLTKYNIDIE